MVALIGFSGYQLVQVAWLVVLAFCSSNVVISFSIGYEAASEGHTATAFSSIWMSITSLVYSYYGSLTTFNKAIPSDIGFVLGAGIALAANIFMLSIYYLCEIEYANDDHERYALATMGSFYLFNSVSLALFSTIFYIHRDAHYKFPSLHQNESRTISPRSHISIGNKSIGGGNPLTLHSISE